MKGLYFLPPRGAFVDPRTGELTRAAVLFLRGVFERVGGATGESTTDLNIAAFEDAGVEELKAGVYGFIQESSQAPPAAPAPPADDPLFPLVAALQDQVAELTKQIEALRQGTFV